MSFQFPPKTGRKRFGIKLKAFFRAHNLHAKGFVRYPALYLATSYGSLILTSLAVWTLFRTSHFWQSVWLFSAWGWAGMLLLCATLWQVKFVKASIQVPIVGAFLLSGLTFLSQDARNTTVTVLSAHFPFSVAQLTEALDTGSRLVLGIDLMSLAMYVTLVWYIAFAIFEFASLRNKPKRKSGWILFGSLGALAAAIMLAGMGQYLKKSYGIDVALVQSAYDWDFTENFMCKNVQSGSRVLLSKISDTVGYSVSLSLPDRSFARMKDGDKDLVGSVPKHLGSAPSQFGPVVRVVDCNELSKDIALPVAHPALEQPNRKAERGSGK